MVYQAYFVHGVNIGLGEELVKIAADAGLLPAVAAEVLAARSFAPAVDADWQRAGKLGITAVPTHLCGNRRLAGFSSYVDFVKLIGEG